MMTRAINQRREKWLILVELILQLMRNAIVRVGQLMRNLMVRKSGDLMGMERMCKRGVELGGNL
jgi:hypothetical protein